METYTTSPEQVDFEVRRMALDSAVRVCSLSHGDFRPKETLKVAASFEKFLRGQPYNPTTEGDAA